MTEEFDLRDYLSRQAREGQPGAGGMDQFEAVLDQIRRAFAEEWEKSGESLKKVRLEREKRAIIGYEEETRYYKEKIRSFLLDRKLLNAWHPPWYPDLTEAVFAELYGLAGLAPWVYDMDEKYRDSSSAKLIGDRLYCLIGGHSVLQPQRIPEERRQQLKRTLLLATPAERLEYGFHEVYLKNGIRITIYSGSRTKPHQDVIVFRKYVLKELTFDALAAMGTIPDAAVPLFLAMIRTGANMLFCGAVRSGKTTFLQTWQRYEDPDLEGVAVATDPETPWEKIMPEAPVMQLVADGKQLEEIMKSLLRGDNDYILLEEMRDAAAFKLALDITSTGTRRSKATIHDNDAVNIPFRMASRIREKYGGDLNEMIAQVYKNFDYCVELAQDPDDRSRKIMTGIVRFEYDAAEDQARAVRICRYVRDREEWQWKAGIRFTRQEENLIGREQIQELMGILRGLELQYPLEEDPVTIPAYYRGRGGRE